MLHHLLKEGRHADILPDTSARRLFGTAFLARSWIIGNIIKWALTQVCGVDLLTAAALAGLLGPGQRFRTDAEIAAFAGVAPLETSSAARVRHRLNRGGNRRLNSILYRIALTQARCSPDAQAYLARRQAEGKTWREAIRALKRHIVRAIWRRWQECQAQAPAVPPLGTARPAA